MLATVEASRTSGPGPACGRALMITDTKVPVPTAARTTATTLADFFSAAEARMDRWRQLSAVARAWQATATRGTPDDALFAEAVALFGEVAPLEAFFAYPGARLMAALE